MKYRLLLSFLMLILSIFIAYYLYKINNNKILYYTDGDERYVSYYINTNQFNFLISENTNLKILNSTGDYYEVKLKDSDLKQLNFKSWIKYYEENNIQYYLPSGCTLLVLNFRYGSPDVPVNLYCEDRN